MLPNQTRSQLTNLELKARLIVEGFMTGLHKSPYHGFSVEFAEHRPYNPGDELRHIDWKVFAKTERFHVKQYEEETNLRQYVVLDTSASMRYKHSSEMSKLEYASHLAAAFHFLMAKQRDATGLITFDEKVNIAIPPKNTQSHVRSLLVQLENVNRATNKPKTAAASALHEIAERITRRSLVVILTDLFENMGNEEELLKALKHLRHRKHEVLVFHILEGKTEREFEFSANDAPVILKDLETGEEMSLQPSQIRGAYTNAVQSFSNNFRKRCLEYNIDFIEIDTAQGYNTALLNYLNKRKKLS